MGFPLVEVRGPGCTVSQCRSRDPACQSMSRGAGPDSDTRDEQKPLGTVRLETASEPTLEPDPLLFCLAQRARLMESLVH